MQKWLKMGRFAASSTLTARQKVRRFVVPRLRGIPWIRESLYLRGTA